MKSIEKNVNYFFACLLIGTFLAGLIYVFLLNDTLRYWDEEHYLLLAKHLQGGTYSFDGIHPTAFQPPGFPFFLYLFSWISSEIIFLRFINFLCLLGAISLLYFLLKNEENCIAALCGAIIASAYPLFFYSAGTFYPQILTSMIFLGMLLCMSMQTIPSLIWEIFTGILMGLLILTSPSFLAYIPFLIMYPWFLLRPKRLRAASILLISATLMVGCWTMRNAYVFGHFIPVSTNSGINFLLGNSEGTTPNRGVNADLKAYLLNGEKLNEYEQDQYYKHQAYQWIKNNPKDALKLYLLKFINFFNFRNELATVKEQSEFKDILLFITYYPLLLLALLRLAWYKRYPLQLFEKLLALLFMISPFLQAIFFTRIRFRIPIDFLTIYFAASVLSIFLYNHWPRLDSERVKASKKKELQ